MLLVVNVYNWFMLQMNDIIGTALNFQCSAYVE